MDQFFTKCPRELKKLQFLFEKNDVSDNAFYALTNSDIAEILKGTDALCLIEFISKFTFEKNKMIEDNILKSSDIEAMEIDVISNESVNSLLDLSNRRQVDFQDSHENHNAFPASLNSPHSQNDPVTHQDSLISPNEPLPSMESDTPFYVKNDLFIFLNSTLEGRILLGVYKNTKYLDYFSLKNMIIFDKLKDDPRNYKIDQLFFNEVRKQFIELFPSEDPDLFFQPYVSDDKDCTSAGGCLYNYYRTIRTALRTAGILTSGRKRKADESIDADEYSSAFNRTENINCLTDSCRENYSLTEILQVWDNTFQERVNLLKSETNKKIGITTAEKYFLSFPCLCPPNGILLLQADFKKIVEEWANEKLIEKSLISKYSSLFSDSWPNIAKKICKHAKKLKGAEIKEFIKKNEDLFNGNHDSLLALFIVPLAVKANKTYKVNKEVVVLTKKEISRTFILHIEEVADVDREREKFEKWVQDTCGVPLHPYLICTGQLPQIKIYVVVNKDKYLFEDPVAAVEVCYKCIKSLHITPPLCDYVWHFIDRIIYNLNPRTTAFVSKYVLDIKRLE